MSDAATPEPIDNLPDLNLTPEEKQWAEHFVAEALIRGAELRESVSGQVHVKGFTCPYCDTMSLSFEAAHDHDGVCDKHPMAERAKKAEARIAELEQERDAARSMADAVAEGRIKDNKQAYVWRDERDSALALVREAVEALEKFDALWHLLPEWQRAQDGPLSTVHAFLAKPEVKALGGEK